MIDSREKMGGREIGGQVTGNCLWACSMFVTVRVASRIASSGSGDATTSPLVVPAVCSIWWQFIPYFLVGVSEVFCNIGTMELFYTQVKLGQPCVCYMFHTLCHLWDYTASPGMPCSTLPWACEQGNCIAITSKS